MILTLRTIGIDSYDAPGLPGVSQDNLPALRADVDTPLPRSSRPAEGASIQIAKSLKKLDFLEKPGFLGNS